jgi:hypothetical protein
MPVSSRDDASSKAAIMTFPDHFAVPQIVLVVEDEF